MRRWILPLVLLIVAVFAAWQAVRTDDALAQELDDPAPTAPAAGTPLLSVRRVPDYLRGPTLLENLQRDLDELTEAFPSLSCLVVSLDGEELFAERPTLPLVPASTQKLVTAYGVHELLDRDLRYTTRLVSDAPVVDGVLDGDVWLIGGGDPVLATAAYASRYEEPELFTDLEILADAVVAAGIVEIAGAVIGDETRYDEERYHSEWPDRFAVQNQTGPLSALTVNDGFVVWDAENPASALNTPAADPARFAAAFFDDLLEARDIVIRSSSSTGAAPVGARDLVSPLVSEPVASLSEQMVRISDNMAAELLLKEIGLDEDGFGSIDVGAAAVDTLLRERGFPVTEVAIDDGSGLSSFNRLTCRLLVQLLESDAGSTLRRGLAVAGESGTLRERMLGTPAVGRVAAKTGRLNEVGSLAGVATAADGSELVFAWIGNTTGFYPIDDMIQVQDRLAVELVEYPEGPSVDALAPIG